MGRMSIISDSDVFAAVGLQLASDGGATLQSIVASTGVSIGSLYHRYGSREGLLAETWLDAVKTFHGKFLKALESGENNAGELAALATPSFCREEHARAVVLSCCRQSEFLSDDTPARLRNEISTVNDNAAAAIRRYARRNNASLDACRLAMVAFPLGAVRLYLPNRPVPKAVDQYVSAAYRATMKSK